MIGKTHKSYLHDYYDNSSYKIVHIIYLNLLLLSNWIPILGCNPDFPVNVHTNLTTFWITAIYPEACQVVPSFLSSKREIPMCCVLLMMKIVSIRRCYLKKTFQVTDDFKKLSSEDCNSCSPQVIIYLNNNIQKVQAFHYFPIKFLYKITYQRHLHFKLSWRFMPQATRITNVSLLKHYHWQNLILLSKPVRNFLISTDQIKCKCMQTTTSPEINYSAPQQAQHNNREYKNTSIQFKT